MSPPVTSRWESILDSKPVPLLTHLLNEVAKQLVADLRQWPPPVAEPPVEPSPFAQFYREPSPKPTHRVYEEALQLIQWELERQFDAIDDYMRNHRWAAAGQMPADKPRVLLLTQWLVEQLLSLAEATQGRVNRPKMIEAVSNIRRLLEKEKNR